MVTGSLLVSRPVDTEREAIRNRSLEPALQRQAPGGAAAAWSPPLATTACLQVEPAPPFQSLLPYLLQPAWPPAGDVINPSRFEKVASRQHPDHPITVPPMPPTCLPLRVKVAGPKPALAGPQTESGKRAGTTGTW